MAAGGRRSYLPGAGPERGAGPHARLRWRGARVGGGVGGEVAPLSAAGRPTPAAASASRAHAQPPERQLALASAPRERGSSLVLRRLCGFPGTWYPRLGKLALSPAALREAAETERSGKLGTSEHRRTVPLAP